jgi:hypothetical protein
MLEVSFKWINGEQIWFLSGFGRMSGVEQAPSKVLKEGIRLIEDAMLVGERRRLSVGSSGDQSCLNPSTVGG